MLSCSIAYVVKWTFLTTVINSISAFYGSITLCSILIKWARQGKSFWEVKERTLPPKCLNDIKYGRHSFIQLPGSQVKIHYVENGDRSKPLMLFVHGFPEFWFTWRKQLVAFSKTHWVVAIDLRGYGQSDKPPGIRNYKMEILVKDIYGFVKALGRDKCILIGHDWGGAIAWVTAATCPDLVQKLIILNAPHPGAMAAKLRSSLKQFFKSWYIFFFQIPYFPEICYRTNDLRVFDRLFAEEKMDKEEMEGYKFIWGQKGAWTPPINYYRNLLSARDLLQPKILPKVSSPTLVIWGENDLALEKELAEMSRPFVQNLQIEYVKEASHFVQHEKAEQVNALIKEFVS